MFFTRDERAAVVVTQKFNQEAENAVPDEIYAEIVTKVPFHNENEHDRRENKEERRLVKLGGVYLFGQIRELYAEEAVGHLTVAAAREEASDASERVTEYDTYGEYREHVKQT